ncbi:hypothetical protein MVEN_00936400 [Mycena venus]|uniref:EF-hand domain-containing protein n=1 Tax=Mycena venus TaxID=2733690 RepID=A0A8H7D1X3_9AGAR|nr:hypothetical protein MVEN_00936400 [Mycena venus]
MNNDTMDTKLTRANATLQKTKELVEQEATSSISKKQTKERIRKILSGIQQAVSVVEGVAAIDPRAQAVVSVFKGLIKLEADRRDNNEQIVGVCYSMTTMVYSLRGLLSQKDENSEELEQELLAMTASMEDFGIFADLYYNKCKSKIIRFLRSGEFKDKLTEYTTKFSGHQEKIEFLLVIQMAGDYAQMKVDIRALLDRMGTPMNDEERKAQELINNEGGLQEVIENQEVLKAVGKLLEDQVTSATIQVLKENLDALIDENRTQFEFKLDGVKMELKEAINRSTQTIIGRLDAGPHDFVDDPEIKEIWRVDGWKLSVKCRTFVDGVCNHFNQRFREAASKSGGILPPEAWTLKILTNVINHPAIGEAIDEDSSGFVSVHEINHFMSQKGDTSTPVWLAYWAIGWQYLNFKYTESVNDFLDQIEEKCEAAKANLTDTDLETCVEYLKTIKLLRYIVNWVDVVLGGGYSAMEDVDEQTGSELELVVAELSQKNEQLVRENLKRINFELQDPALLVFVTQQSGVRIEQVIMLMLHLILSEHSDAISNGQTMANDGTQSQAQRTGDRKFTSQWQSMDATLSMLVFVFHARMRSLIRSWRSQKLDLALQVQCYAGGLYAGWYQEYTKPGSVIVKLLEAEDNDDENEEPQSSSGDIPNASATESMDTKMDNLSTRVSQLDARLDTLEALLRRLLGVHVNTNGNDEPAAVQDLN